MHPSDHSPIDDLFNRWAIIGPTSGEEFLTTSSIETRSGRKLRMGVDSIGFRHLLIPVGPSDRKVPTDVSGALVLVRQPYKFDGLTSLFLDIKCVRSDLFDVFDELLRDVVKAVSDGAGADAAIEVVDRWRTLLTARGRRKLSESAQRGLAAELNVLLMVTPAGHSIDVGCWRGPLSEPHDIVLPKCAIEVKSVGAQTRNVEIHGIFQLSPPGKPLALVLVQLIEEQEGETISELAERLVNRAADRSLAQSRLSLAGFSQLDADDYSLRFKVGDILVGDVDGDFPRIAPSSFTNGAAPAGISYLTYGLEFSAIKQHLRPGFSALIEWQRSVCES